MKTKITALLILLFINGKSFHNPNIPVLDNASWILTQYFFGGIQESQN